MVISIRIFMYLGTINYYSNNLLPINGDLILQFRFLFQYSEITLYRSGNKVKGKNQTPKIWVFAREKVKEIR